VRAAAAIPAIGLLAGCGLGSLASGPEAPVATVPALLTGALLVAGLAAVLAWRGSRPELVAAATCVAFAAGGARLAADAWQQAWRPSLRVEFERLAGAERARALAGHRLLPEDDEAFAIVAGVLRSDAAPSESGASLSVAVREGLEGREGQEGRDRRVRGGLLVTVVGSLAASRVEEWRAGRYVRMPVQLHRPGRYLDPGVPDGERILARSDTTLVGTVKSGTLVEVERLGSGWDEHAATLRLFTRRTIDRFVGRWSRESAAIVTAILIGDRAGLNDEVQRRLQEAGTYHVIAISGGNIAILAGLLLGLFRLGGYFGRAAMIAVVATLVAYAGVVNGGTSVSRATLMAVIYFGARACDQRSPPLNALWTTSFLLLVGDPLVAGDPGFILTFGATVGILVSQRLPQSTQSKRSTQNSQFLRRGKSIGLSFSACSAVSALYVVIVQLFRASLAAEAMLFPVGAAVFSRVTFAGLALNFVAIPMMGVAQIAGLLVLPAAIVSSDLAFLAGWVAHAGAAGLVWSADLVRLVPAVTYRIAPPSWGAVGAYYLALAVSWALWRQRMQSGSAELPRAARARRVASATAVGAAVWILVPASLFGRGGDGRLHVTFLDVGQGDSALVRFPRGATMLVDAGGVAGAGSFDIGDRVVAPVLRDAGLRQLDYLVLTHGDPDHVGGAAAVIDEFRPREVWEGIPVPSFRPLESLRLQAQSLDAHWANVYRGSRIVVDGVEIRAIHPSPADWERQKVRNDDSVTLELRWGDVSVLLTGDIGRAVEGELARDIQPAPIRVIKVPHHGSLTSSSAAFLRAVRPAVAIVSAGRANHFGHPAPAVLQRYREVGAELFRTDQDGAVFMETDGHTLDVRTFAGRHFELSATTAHHDDTKGTKNTKP
jgi:competence protein ComEC